MENINGALGFEATLNIDDFNVSAKAMERHIQQASTNIQAESANMEQSLLDFAKRGALYLQTYLVGQGMAGVLNSIVSVRGQFQQLEIAFGTMLGSEEKAKDLMNQMINTAAKTPFDLAGVAGGAKQLLAYGESADKVNDTLVRLGNIASGLSIPLNDIVYLYGTTMVQGRLYAQDVRQFTGRGIPLVKELAAMYGVTAEEINNMVSAGKIGFPDVEKVILKLTDSGGQFYNLMEKQSASLTGMISNLEDAWDSMLNDIGKSNQDLFAGAIDSAAYMVEHYQQIFDILKSVAIAYGSVKAGIVLNTLATKGYTGVALLDNTARQAKIALMKVEATLTGTNKAQTDAMTAARQAHVAALQAELTAEEQDNLVKQLRIATISQLLTAQQQEYLSNLNLTTSSAGYEAAAMQILTVDQQMALKKTDLTSKSALYIAALEQEVAAKRQSSAATLEAMRTNVKAAAAKMEATKQTAVAAMQATEAARYEVYWAKQSGDATRIAVAQKKLEGAEDNQATARKAALAASTDFYAKKKLLEANASKTATAAGAADTAGKAAQTAATRILTTVTTGLTGALKSLWATMVANPFTAILSVLGLVVSAFTLFKSTEEETNDATGEFNNTTQEEINKLQTYMAIVKTSASGTKTHKDAIEKVNQICKEYNKTLLDENATLDEQRAKYNELKAAIQETTAEKIRAKYTEKAQNEQTDARSESLGDLRKAASKAGYMERSSDRAITASDAIRGASDAVWEAVESMAIDSADRLKDLTGDAYTEAFEKSLEDIVLAVQESTNATDKEMDAFKSNLRTYLSDIANSEKKAKDEIAKVDEQLAAFYGKKPDAKAVVESTDYVSMTFDELAEKLKANQKEIDNLNAKLASPGENKDGLAAKLKECLDLQKHLSDAANTKTNGLNTEAGISARIKQLKDEKEALEINSEAYNERKKAIEELQKKLSSASGPDDKSTQNLSQKQLDAQRKLEEARIAIMEDGYAKRKAMLDLEHKRNLDAIKKEEDELIAANRKAGLGGLTSSQQGGFDERRALENQSYESSSTKLFDAEINYRKQQYEAYWQWVRNVGEDVANAHFEDLISEGTSFARWVNTQIASLEKKKAEQPDLFSAGDANALNSLKSQQNEITGNKSAMDLFKESVERTVGQAQTLADKLEAIVKLREKLSNGSFHLNQDDTAAASYQLESQESQIQKEVQDTLLNDYKTYNEKKLDIQKQYSLLLSAAEKEGNAERIAQVRQGQEEALSTLNASMLMQSDDWKKLFTDLDTLTTAEIDKLIKEIQTKMSTADLNLSPTDLQTILDKLEEAKKKVLDTNPFKALGNSLKEVFTTEVNGSKKTSTQIKADWKNLADSTSACFNFVDDAIDSCDVLSDMIGDTGKATISMIGGITTAGIAMAEAIKTVEKGSVILAAISIALQAIQWVATVFDKEDDIQRHTEMLESHIQSLKSSFDRLQNAMSHTYWVYTDEEKEAYKQRKEAIEEQIALLQQQLYKLVPILDTVQIRQVKQQIEDLEYELEKNTTQNGDIFTIYEEEIKNLENQITSTQGKIRDQEKSKERSQSTIDEYNETIKDYKEQIDDLKRSMVETLAGTDVQSALDDFADALVDAYVQGEDAADALAEKTKSVLKNAVVEALKRQYLAKAVNDAVEYLADSMQDSVLSDAERAKFTSMISEAGDSFNAALAAVGDWIKDLDATETEDSLSGAIQSLSESTGDIIAGRLNAAIINQADQTRVLNIMAGYLKAICDGGSNVGISDISTSSVVSGINDLYEQQESQADLMRQQLEYQAQIAYNTGVSKDALTDIKQTLRRMEGSNTLLSQGIS